MIFGGVSSKLWFEFTHTGGAESLCVPLSLTVAVCRARGQSDVKPVVGKVGGDVRMDIGATEVDRDALIVWSYGPEHKVIISYDDGTSETKPSEKFQLDANRSLTIRSLTANDSGLYKGQIFSKNGSSQSFNLAVVGEYSKQRITPCNIKSYNLAFNEILYHINTETCNAWMFQTITVRGNLSSRKLTRV